jgi:hypothetical protein
LGQHVEIIRHRLNKGTDNGRWAAADGGSVKLGARCGSFGWSAALPATVRSNHTRSLRVQQIFCKCSFGYSDATCQSITLAQRHFQIGSGDGARAAMARKHFNIARQVSSEVDCG